MDLPTSERLGTITVLRGFSRALRYCYFLLQSRCIPCLIASPLEMLCTLQYSCNFFSVSRSNLIVNFTSLGLSTLGLPVLGLNSSPHFLPCINFTKCQTKSQEFFRKKYFFYFLRKKEIATNFRNLSPNTSAALFPTHPNPPAWQCGRSYQKPTSSAHPQLKRWQKPHKLAEFVRRRAARP